MKGAVCGGNEEDSEPVHQSFRNLAQAQKYVFIINFAGIMSYYATKKLHYLRFAAQALPLTTARVVFFIAIFWACYSLWRGVCAMQKEQAVLGNTVLFGKLYMANNFPGTPDVKLHYIVYKEADLNGKDGFTGVTLELGLTSWGQEPEDAQLSLLEFTEKAVIDLHSDEMGRKQFIEELKDTSLESLWGLYRHLTYLFGDPERRHLEHLSNQIHERDQEIQAKDTQIRERDEKISELKVDLDSLKAKTHEKIYA